jgi:hypothetical protein
MPRMYTAQVSAVAVTASQDLWEIVAASGKPVQIIGIDLSQTSDSGDGQEEFLLVQFKSGQTTSGSGGSTPTPVPISVSDSAGGMTVEANNTTKASGGTIVTHWSTSWNVRSPGLIMLPDEFRFELTGGRRGTIEISAPGDSLTLNSTIWLKELG